MPKKASIKPSRKEAKPKRTIPESERTNLAGPASELKMDAPKVRSVTKKKPSLKPVKSLKKTGGSSKAFKKNETEKSIIAKSNVTSVLKITKEAPKNDNIKTDFAEDILGSAAVLPMEKAQIYDELIAQEMEREIIRSQRKQTAGKDTFKKTSKKVETGAPAAPVLDRIVEIPDIITVKEFAEKTGLGAAKVIGELMKNGILANINQQIDYDTAQIIADDLSIKIKKKRTEASAKDVFLGNLESLLKEEDPADLQQRPPIVVVMGHVDHGKTKLLDCIRETDIVSREAGGITQHIGAYQVEKNHRKITFLDTPGHEAFTAMRARGARVTDIAVLVVAADEGVKPQTVEAIQHVQEANVPIIVAINKIDKEEAQPDRVKGELGEYGLVPEEWGGKTIMTPVSAMTGQGIAHLLEMILLLADMENLRANPNREAVATVIEANLNPSLGPVATIIINTGTLRVMDNFVVGSTYGRIKVMKDQTGHMVESAGPSMPVLIAGMPVTPQSGDILHVMPSEQVARQRAVSVMFLKEADIIKKRGVGEIISQISSGQLKQLKLVLKADTKGSLEALKQSISQIKNESVGVKIILSGVGNVTESDVMMAAAGGGIVMGFNLTMYPNVKKLAERENIEVLHYNIIYNLLDDIKKILTGLLEPEIVENILGRAELKKIFLTEKKEMIIGCKIVQGHIENKTKVRVFRNDQLMGEGLINSLKSFDKAAHEVNEGNDCGIRYGGFMPIQEGDILESYKLEKRVRTL